MKRPVPLKRGDRVALVCMSSPIKEERLDAAVEAVKNMGLIPVLGESVRSVHGYLAGSDEVRACDLNRMFYDKSIKGIFAMRGGYGCVRILDKLDYKTIKKNPKVFAGYSDVTILHNVLNDKCSMITYHGPMPATEFYKGVDDYTMKCFLDSVFSSNSNKSLMNPQETKMKTLVSGQVEGKICGGNLTLVASTMGTKYEIDTKGKILFLEDIDEYLFRIDRMLMQLKLCNKFKDAEGIVLGSWKDCKAADEKKSLTLMEIFNEIIVPENKPVIYDVCFGHCLPSMTLPMGANIRLDTDCPSITLLN